MLNGKDIFTFVRFGGLDLKNQKGFSKDDDDYHTPPAPRGIYAMPKIAQDFFLIGCISITQPGIFPKNKFEEDGILIDNSKVAKKRYREIRKEFRKTNGEIWHHLEEYTNHKDILQRHNSWIKTDMKTWSKAFSKMSTSMRYGRMKYDLENGVNVRGDGKGGITGWYSKDHCEVFFDEKV
jgi:hypothetical protein